MLPRADTDTPCVLSGSPLGYDKENSSTAFVIDRHVQRKGLRHHSGSRMVSTGCNALYYLRALPYLLSYGTAGARAAVGSKSGRGANNGDQKVGCPRSTGGNRGTHGESRRGIRGCAIYVIGRQWTSCHCGCPRGRDRWLGAEDEVWGRSAGRRRALSAWAWRGRRAKLTLVVSCSVQMAGAGVLADMAGAGCSLLCSRRLRIRNGRLLREY